MLVDTRIPVRRAARVGTRRLNAAVAQSNTGDGKANWAQYGIGVPKGGVATNAAEAEKIAQEIGRCCEADVVL